MIKSYDRGIRPLLQLSGYFGKACARRATAKQQASTQGKQVAVPHGSCRIVRGKDDRLENGSGCACMCACF